VTGRIIGQKPGTAGCDETARGIARDHGADEVYVFGSIIEPFGDDEPNDIDLAVSGFSARSFLHAYGVLLSELEHPFDLVDLDSDNRFSRRPLKKRQLE
jgi:predicted nucleotidyltransferase